ncbi:MAG: formylglycine-generating enzyme family protein [Myxococcota bacterium]
MIRLSSKLDPSGDPRKTTPMNAHGIALASAVALMTTTPPPACPAGMTRVPGLASCIDRYEASLTSGDKGAADGRGTTAKAQSKAGRRPAVRVSQLQAKAMCANANKRLCTRAEWLAACQGSDGKRTYAYGSAFVSKRCHDRPLAAQRDLTEAMPTGSLKACRTPEGVYDLSGNVWEWLADSDAEVAALIGGGFGNDDHHLACQHPAEHLSQPVTQQAEALGFRCCVDLPKQR